MKLEYILADTTSLAMKAALSNLSLCAKNNVLENYLVLVPETKTLEAEQMLLKNNKAFMNVSINSFDRLLEKIDVVIKNKPLTRETGIMLIRKIVYEMRDDLVCFKKSASSIGFIESIYDTISQIKSSGLSPEEFSLSSKNAKQSLKLKLKDISLIYDAYESELANTYNDASDRLDILATAVKESEWIKSSHVLVCGYDSITAKAMNLIKSILITAKDVTVACSFMHPNNKNYHIAETEVFDKFKALSATLHIPYNPTRIENNFSSDFKHLKDNLYGYPVEVVKPSGNISLYNFPSPYAELDNICKLIKYNVRQGKRYNEMAMVYCGLEENKRLIEEKMKEYEIPYFISKPYDFATHPLFTCIKSFLDMVRKGLDQACVISFIKNFFVDAPNKQEFENYTLQYGINRSKFLKPFMAGGDKNEDRVKAEECRIYLESILTLLMENINNAKTYKDYVNCITILLEKLQIESQINKLSEMQKELEDNIGEAISDQIIDKCNAVFEGIVSFLGDTKTTLEEFSLLLQSGLSSSDVSLIPQTIDCLRIQSNGDGINEISDLFICGATEGKFPIKSEDCGMISDSEIGYLAESTNKKIEPTIRTLNRRERFRAYELLLLPSNTLTLSCFSFNIKGEEEKTSSIFGMISKMFFDGDQNLPINQTVFNSELLKIDDEYFARFNPTIKNATKNFLQSAHSKNKGANLLSKNRINDLYFSLKEHGFKFEEIKAQADKKDTYINNADKLFFTNGKTSVSELENYFNCPFLHFVNFGLKIKERKQSDIRAVDVGDILHQLVEYFMKLLIQGKEQDPKKLLHKILANEKYILEENKIIVKILESESQRICNALKIELNSSKFKPTGFEVWYGDKGKVKALQLDADVKVEGKIDRIDTLDDKLRVIDYKTGKIDDKPADIYYGKKIQLITYLCALDELKFKPVASLYFPIRNEFAGSEEESLGAYKMKGIISSNSSDLLAMDKSITFDNPKSKIVDASISASKKNKEEGTIVVNKKSNIIDSDDFDKIKKYVKSLLQGAVKEIKKGYVAASPISFGDVKPCDYCKYKNVCGIDRSENDMSRKCSSKITLNDIAEVEHE